MAKNKVVYGNTPLIDLTTDTATAENVLLGNQFMGSNGVVQTGTMQSIGATASGTNISIAGKTYQPPSNWATGSDEEIYDIVIKAHKGWIDLAQYWNTGQQRQVSLTDGNTVILKLGTPLYGGAFSLIPKYATYGSMKMGTTSGTYVDNSTLRTWCKTTYYNKFPQYLKDILLPAYAGDLFYIPSDEEALSLMGIMNTSSNVAVNYWTRTKPKYDRFYVINTSGTKSTYRGSEDSAYAIPLGEI